MFYPLLAATLALTLQQPLSPATATPPGETASATLFASDTRLTKKVTVPAAAITLNDLLQKITRQTGVTVKMRDRKILGEQKVCLFAEEVEARQILEAIAALLRYRNTNSEWQKSATGDGYALSVGGYAKNSLQKKEGVAPPLDIPYPALSEEGAPAVEVEAVRVTIGPPASDTLVEGVAVDNAPALSGNALLLPEAEKARQLLIEGWLTRYDARKSSLDNSPLPDGNPTIPRLFSEIARKQNAPVLVLLPEALESGETPFVEMHPGGDTIADFLGGLATTGYRLHYKWHKGALLLRDPAAPFR